MVWMLQYEFYSSLFFELEQKIIGHFGARAFAAENVFFGL